MGVIRNVQLGPEYDGRLVPFTYEEVAWLCRVHVKTLMRWVKLGQVPQPQFHGHAASFDRATVEKILQGPALPRTYLVTPSPRSATAKKAKRKKENKAASKRPVTRTIPGLGHGAAGK